MTKRMRWMLLGLFLVLAPVFGFIAFKNEMTSRYLASYEPPPSVVSATFVQSQAWEQSIHAVGTLQAVDGLSVSSEVSGIVRRSLFDAGQTVDKNQRLVLLDDSVEQGNLRSLRAQLRLAEINFERDKKLRAKKSISQTAFDKTEAQFKDVSAQVERTEAIIRQKSIRAPFGGEVGIPEYNIGQFIERGQSLVTLQDLSQMYIDLSLPSRFVPQLKVGQEVRCALDAYLGDEFVASVQAINVVVDDNTRSVKVRASISNPERKLLPGMFVSARLIVGEPQQRLTIPSVAVSYNLYGDSVFVLNATDEAEIFEVERRYITQGDVRDKEVWIAEGLSAGEQIVTAGQLKLRNGTKVKVNNSIAI